MKLIRWTTGVSQGYAPHYLDTESLEIYYIKKGKVRKILSVVTVIIHSLAAGWLDYSGLLSTTSV